MYSGKRQVLLFYNEAGKNLKTDQLNVLNADKKGLSERDITIHLFETNAAADEIKKWQINTSKPFTFLLIGKDGGEKFRSVTIVPLKKLLATIDAMPIRKTEMKAQKDNQ